MNKTVTANISGVVFHIEADAYEKLNQYLNTIRKYFRDSDGTDEIMADIEARIAELFKEGMEAGKEVVTDANVQKVIEVMGEPEQYMDPEASENYSESTNYSESSRNSFRTKKLFRDTDDNVLGGVCSGLGYYFGVDRIWFRAAFLIAIFGLAFGIIPYIILWMIIPAAKTTADKLEMKGEPINVENIGNAIKDEFDTFKKKVNKGDTRHYGKKAENAAYKFFDFLSKLIVFALKFIAKLIGIVFVIFAVMCIISIIAAIFGGPFHFSIDHNSFVNFWDVDIAEVYFSSSTMFYTGLIGLAIVILIPLLGLLYSGVRILFNVPNSNKVINISSISLLFIGVIMVSIAGTTALTQYSNTQNIREEIILDEFNERDTVELASTKKSYPTSDFGSFELFVEDGEIYISDLEVDVIKSTSGKVELKLRKRAQGANRKEASQRAENIMFEYIIEDDKLMIDPFINVPYDDGFRGQDLNISIALPVGKSIYLAPSSRDIIYDIENITNTHDRKMMGHHWFMTEEGLKCTDCEWLKEEEEIETPEVPDAPDTPNTI